MAFDPKGYEPKPNLWFQTEVVYEGLGEAHFSKPAGYVRGPAKVIFDETGKGHIELTIEEFECEEPLGAPCDIDNITWLLNGREPLFPGFHPFGLTPRNVCHLLTVTSSQGVYRASGRIYYPLPHLPNFGEVIDFYPEAYSEYTIAEVRKPVYWVMPLTNFVSDELILLRPMSDGRHPLDTHPLRLFPTPKVPEGLPETDYRVALHYANRHNCLIPFACGGHINFIERLLDYHERSERLKDKTKAISITSVMVGDCDDRSILAEEAIEWLPLHCLHVLSLASGSQVGTPWIEFRDYRGDLVKRIHTRQWQRPYAKGHAAIRLGTGTLLTGSPDSLDVALRTAILLVVRASDSHLYMEDRIVFLAIAADALTEQLRRTEVDVTLSKENRDLIAKLIQDTSDQIKDLASKAAATDGDECRRMADIVRATVNRLGKRELKHDEAIVHLTAEYGLKDFRIIPEKEWKEEYRKFRNQIVHTGYVPEDMGYENAARLSYHLHDLLLRIILKKLKYSGRYRRAVRIKEDISVDWVTDTTPLDQLWYLPAEDG